MLLALAFSACSDSNSQSTKIEEISEDNLAPIDSSLEGSSDATKLPFVGGSVMFTEVDPINIVYEDHEGGDAGWVELFNTSADTVDLSGMYLTEWKIRVI